MQSKDELLTIAEIAVGLAGFSGVVAAFLHRGGLSPADRVRFVAMFSIAFATVVLAFLPIALFELGCTSQSTWRLSSLAMLTAGLVTVAFAPRGIRQIRSDLKGRSQAPPALILVPFSANILLQAANAAGLFWHPAFVPYLVGMLVALYVAGVLFLFIVLFRPPAA